MIVTRVCPVRLSLNTRDLDITEQHLKDMEDGVSPFFVLRHLPTENIWFYLAGFSTLKTMNFGIPYSTYASDLMDCIQDGENEKNIPALDCLSYNLANVTDLEDID